MKTAQLAEIATINPRAGRLEGDLPISFVGMAELDDATARAIPHSTRQFREVAKGYTVFRDRDLLVAKITPCFENGKIGQAFLDHAVGVGSTEFHVVRAGASVDERYLLHFLRSPGVRRVGAVRMTGSAGQRRVPSAFLETLQVPLPPLDEQRRIAAILDQADATRAMRQRNRDHLRALGAELLADLLRVTDSGDQEFSTLVKSMRNGVSPSTAGVVSARVLTLSAITRGAFDARASKMSTFDIEPDSTKRVDSMDFLICRGNGNLGLVGIGVSPDGDHPGLVFPDTVIAARLDGQVVRAAYLEHAWRLPQVRSQIESVARTTNGTFKVNQAGLARIRVPLPPLELQQEFAARVAEIEAQRARVQRAIDLDDELFASLQSRAFKGEL